MATFKTDQSMSFQNIISAIDEQIARRTHARDLVNPSSTSVEGSAVKPRPGRPKKEVARKRQTISPEGRARIAAAQKKRWAKAKRT
jgi:hypothetical protein